MSFSLDEGKSSGSAIHLLMDTTIPGEEVTALHLHEGVPGENGPVLFTLPVLPYPGPLTVGAVWDYEGDIGQLMALVRSGRVYLDIHTRARPAGALRAQLAVESFAGPSGYYCS